MINTTVICFYCSFVNTVKSTTLIERVGSSAVDSKRFLESKASSIRRTFTLPNLTLKNAGSIRGTFYRQLHLTQKVFKYITHKMGHFHNLLCQEMIFGISVHHFAP